jgi:dTDP-4-dehydrorhamnose reductase
VRNSGAPHLVVRTSWVYAATGRNFLQSITALALTRPELRVVADQVGAPTSAAVIADVVMEVLTRYGSDIASCFAKVNGLCHVTTTGVTSWYGFACAILDGLRCRGVGLLRRCNFHSYQQGQAVPQLAPLA